MLVGKKRKSDCLEASHSPGFNGSNKIRANVNKEEPTILQTNLIAEQLREICGYDHQKFPGAVKTPLHDEGNRLSDENLCPALDIKHFHRFEVLSVDKQKDVKSVEIKLAHLSTNSIYYCQLSGQWVHNQISPGNIVHIKSDRFERRTFYIDNNQGLITINPDTMVTSTLLSSSVYCMRKAWLGEQFKGWGFGNKYMLVGTIVHTLFQKACIMKITSPEKLEDLLNSIVSETKTVMECLVSGITVAELLSDVQSYIPSIIEWIKKYIIEGPSSLEDDLNSRLQVLSVHDIEDNVWCPALGSKGKIDATVEVEIHSKFRKQAILPLELKTGRPSFSAEHIGQISLYSMMMDNRESAGCDIGLLLYLKDGPKMKLNQTKRPVISSLLQKRNDLAFYLNQPQKGPDPKDSSRSCSKCEHLLDCSLMLKSFEPDKLLSSPAMRDELVPSALSHLTDKDIDFFKHWIGLINLELSENKRLDNDLAFWSESSEVRESKALGLGNLIIHCMSAESIVLRRNSNNSDPLTRNCHDLTGERVAVSVDEKSIKVPSKVAIFIGFVLRMDSDEIEVSVERPLREIYSKVNLRLDLLKYSYTYSANYDNILRLMTDDEHCKRLRNLVIHDQTACYKKTYTRSIVEIAKRVIKPLNEQQQRAVLKVIATEDYLLIRGTPGSGKTSVIVAIIRMLIEMGRSVLITSHTHTAVDNILIKLKDFGVNFVRIGSEHRIHPSLKDYSMANKIKDIKSPEELKQFYASINVVAVTCLGSVSEPLFEARKFDYCLIDEASQVLLPTTLGPLFASSTFILVGDEKQLPPVVRSHSAKEGGLENSLFSRLLSKESSSLQLAIQYRMNQEILSIASKLFYDNCLICGTNKVAEAVLPGPTQVTTGYTWLDQILSCQLSKSFIFLNTDLLEPIDEPNFGYINNEIEGNIVHFLVNQFINQLGLSHDQIGVISPYQKQVSLIKSKLSMENVYVNSVDQYQGKEKDCILISCVKHTRDQSINVVKEEILSDERRLNVAITRASKKLIIIGSKSTLMHYAPFARLLNLLRPDQIVDIPDDYFDI